MVDYDGDRQERGMTETGDRVVQASDREYVMDKHGSLRVLRYASTSSGGKRIMRQDKIPSNESLSTVTVAGDTE